MHLKMSDNTFYKEKKVLVTGGTGFVGTNFVQQLLLMEAKVIVPVHKRKSRIEHRNLTLINADLQSLEDCIMLCEDIDYIFHAAGTVSAASMTVQNPMSAISTNLIITLRILEAAMIKKVKKVLLFSSGTTGYPKYDFPVKEEDMFKDPPADVYFGYGWSRRYTELLGEFVTQKSDVNISICRPSAVYGRYDDFDPKTSHVIPALIRRAVEKEKPYVVWGTGDEIRDFIHVKDLVRGCLLLLEKNKSFDPVNIASGDVITIKEIVDIIIKETKHENAELTFDETKPTTIPKRMINVSKANNELGFNSSINIKEGLQDTIKWYKQEMQK
tara:strand:+ start:1120 stop:2103 length:984 start_codon:yes stop_codon:yes gene_type:complete